MRKLVLALTVIGACLPAYAQNIGPKNQCVDLPASSLINGATMASSRSFAIDRPNANGGYGVLVLGVALVNSGSTITRLDATCTVSLDGNTTDLVPQTWAESAGVFTGTATGTWQRAISGTSYNYPIRLDVEGYPDFECMFSVGAGSGDSGDLLTVTGRLCTK